MAPASAPRAPYQPEHEPDAQDSSRDLDPKKTTKLAQDNLGLGTPIARKGIPDSLDTVRAGPQGPSNPLGFVEKRRAQQNPGQHSSANPKGVHLGVVFERGKLSVLDGLNHSQLLAYDAVKEPRAASGTNHSSSN